MKQFPIFAGALLLAITASGQKISDMQYTNNANGASRFELSEPNGAGGWRTRSTAITNLWGQLSNAPASPIPALGTLSANATGATNGLNTRVGNVEGGTNGLHAGVTGLLARSVTNGNVDPVNLSGSLTLTNNTTNRANLYLKGDSNPKIRITSVVLPQTLEISSQGIGTDSGGGQPYLSFFPEGVTSLRLYPLQFDPVNAGMDLGSTVRPFGSLYLQSNAVAEAFTSTTTPGVASGGLLLYATNQTQAAVTKAAERMGFSVTNISGVWEVVAASVVEQNANKAHEQNVTNRMAATMTYVVTNSAAGQKLRGQILGAASGGSDYTVTFVPHTGQLASNGDDLSAALATSITMTVTNGYKLEWSDAVDKLGGTNIHNFRFGYSKH